MVFSKSDILSTLKQAPADAEIINFGTSYSFMLFLVMSLRLGYCSPNLWRTKGIIPCFHAYAVTASGAKKILEALQKSLCALPVDIQSYVDTRYLAHTHCSTLFALIRSLASGRTSLIRQNKEHTSLLGGPVRGHILKKVFHHIGEGA